MATNVSKLPRSDFDQQLQCALHNRAPNFWLPPSQRLCVKCGRFFSAALFADWLEFLMPRCTLATLILALFAVPVAGQPQAGPIKLTLRKETKLNPLEAEYITLGPADQREWRHRVGTTFFKSLKTLNDRAMRELGEHSRGMMTGLTFSPDGKHLVFANSGRPWLVKVWDIATGKLSHVLRGHTAAIQAIEYSPDGKYIATAGHDQTIRVWDSATGNPVITFAGHTKRVTCLAFDPKQRLLASGSYDGTVRLWSIKSKTRQRLFRGPRNTVIDVHISPDGTSIAAAVTLNPIHVWNMSTGRLTHTLADESGAHGYRLRFLPGSGHVVTVGTEIQKRAPFRKRPFVQVWDLATASVAFEEDLAGGAVTSLDMSADSKVLMIRTQNFTKGGYSVWDVVRD